MDEEKSKAGRKRDISREFQKMNWDPKPGKPNEHRIAKLIKLSDNKQETELKDIPYPNESPNMSKIYVWTNGKWIEQGKRCLDCGKVMSKTQVIEKHPAICDKGLLINKQEEIMNMPIQKVTKNGETYYRWGTQGKLYKDKKDAEAQARAAYASGYKEKK